MEFHARPWDCCLRSYSEPYRTSTKTELQISNGPFSELWRSCGYLHSSITSKSMCMMSFPVRTVTVRVFIDAYRGYLLKIVGMVRYSEYPLHMKGIIWNSCSAYNYEKMRAVHLEKMPYGAVRPAQSTSSTFCRYI